MKNKLSISKTRVLKMKKIEALRQKPRAMVAQPAVGWLGTGTEKHWVRIVDISQTGVRILDLETKPAHGTLVKIWWRLMSGLKEIELHGEVVWTSKGSCGLKFKTLGKREAHLINQFVKFHRNEV